MSYTGEASANAVLVGNGNLVVNGVVYFTSISFDTGTDTLSVYTQGTYSPTLAGSTTNPTVSYSVQVGIYTKIGNLVLANSNITVSAFSGGSGNIESASLPFTSKSTTGYASEGPAYMANNSFGTSVNYYSNNLNGNATFAAYFGFVSGGADVILKTTNCTSTSQFISTLMYSV